ncbi:serine/threonine-protein kinase 38-like isoform X2 [Littorina saxatilis]|uniref:serine/threonine-protein kinase 38-like isoform X2 n=1 Tax=Littorina saxatilis TaxID=31220 RepID=UPI0038B5D122
MDMDRNNNMHRKLSDYEVTDARRLWKEETQHLKLAQKWLQVKTLPADEFNVIKELGRGYCGPVRLVKNKHTGHLYAMKTVHRLRGPEDLRVIAQLNNERTLLMEVNSVWVERMFHSFQDSHYYFELLEYIPGGSLAQLVQQEGTLREYQTRVYGAEMLMAISVLHRHGFMHRNVQPSNFLLDQFGHVKIADFGCSFRFMPDEICQKMSTEPSIKDGKPFISGERRDRVQIYQRKTTDNHGGSLEFMAPEVVRPRATGFLSQLRPAPPGTVYTFACDFWSFGVCLYCMLYGQLPFRGATLKEVECKIIDWRRHLSFPCVQPVSEKVKDLMQRLLCDEPYRLGVTGCEDVMSHVFFDDIDWMNMRIFPVPVPYELEGQDSSSSLGAPDYILQLLRPENYRTSCGPNYDKDGVSRSLRNWASRNEGDSSVIGVERNVGSNNPNEGDPPGTGTHRKSSSRTADEGSRGEGNWASHNKDAVTSDEPNEGSFNVDDLRGSHHHHPHPNPNPDLRGSHAGSIGPQMTVRRREQQGSVNSTNSILSSASMQLVPGGVCDEGRGSILNVSTEGRAPDGLSFASIRGWMHGTSTAAPPPDELYRVAQEDPEALRQVILMTMSASELRSLSKEKELLETSAKEEAVLVCTDVNMK